MEKDNKLSLANIFMWVSSFLGFTVDTIALVSIIKQINTSGISINSTSIPHTINLNALSFNVGDVTIVIILYIGIAFSIISTQFNPNKPEGFISLFLFHLLIGLVFLWMFVFVFSSNFVYVPRLLGLWIVGLFSLLWLKSKAQEAHPLQFFIILFTALSTIVPVWSLLEKTINNLTWKQALFNTLVWGIPGVILVISFWGIFLLVYIWLYNVFNKAEW